MNIYKITLLLLLGQNLNSVVEGPLDTSPPTTSSPARAAYKQLQNTLNWCDQYIKENGSPEEISKLSSPSSH